MGMWCNRPTRAPAKCQMWVQVPPSPSFSRGCPVRGQGSPLLNFLDLWLTMMKLRGCPEGARHEPCPFVFWVLQSTAHASLAVLPRGLPLQLAGLRLLV